MISPNTRRQRETLQLIEKTLRVDSIFCGRTVLEAIHCPDRYLVQEVFGINYFIGGRLTIETPAGKEEVPEGSAVLIPAGVPRKWKNHNVGKTISVHNQLQCSIMQSVDPLMLLDLPTVIGPTYGKRVGEINEAVLKLEAQGIENFLRYAAARHRLAIELLEIILEVSTLKEDASDQLKKAGRLQPALQYVKENLAEKISVADIAESLHVSEPRLYELFREAMGVSPGKYLQQQRIGRAQDLLINTDLRILEVGEAVGYEDQFHFSRLFKKNNGVSPSLFRRQWR